MPICQLSHYRTDVLSALCVRLRPHVCARPYTPVHARLYAPTPTHVYARPCGYCGYCGCLCPPLRVLRVLRVLMPAFAGTAGTAGAYPTFSKCLITRSQLASVMFAGLCTEILPERTSESTESSAMKDHIFLGLENISEAL